MYLEVEGTLSVETAVCMHHTGWAWTTEPQGRDWPGGRDAGDLREGGGEIKVYVHVSRVSLHNSLEQVQCKHYSHKVHVQHHTFDVSCTCTSSKLNDCFFLLEEWGGGVGVWERGEGQVS